MKMLLLPQTVKVRWSGANRKQLESKGYKYTQKGDEIEINVLDLSDGSQEKVEFTCDFCNTPFKSRYSSYTKNEHQFCSRDCKCKWKSANPSKQYTTNCGYCNKEITVVPSQVKKSKSEKMFCSNECVGKYNALRNQENRIKKVCIICNNDYTVKPSEADTSVTCSKECQAKWQSQYLVGENANNYNKDISKEEREVNCYWCGKVESVYPYKVKLIEEGYHHFCSKECWKEWYASDWSQSEDWKKESRLRAVKMLEDGLFNHTDTGCQKVVNNILDDLNVKYQNEYNCNYVSIDNYLLDYNLMIEVMGTFWHSDHRIIKEINYPDRVDGIRKDKIKRSFIKTKYNVNILYLWEEDIMKNPDLCKKLIKLYIDNHGVLDNYHSFNYSLFSDYIKLNNTLMKAYMEYDIEKIRKFINVK
jgi:hypothetical protein